MVPNGTVISRSYCIPKTASIYLSCNIHSLHIFYNTATVFSEFQTFEVKVELLSLPPEVNYSFAIIHLFFLIHLPEAKQSLINTIKTMRETLQDPEKVQGKLSKEDKVRYQRLAIIPNWTLRYIIIMFNIAIGLL